MRRHLAARQHAPPLRPRRAGGRTRWRPCNRAIDSPINFLDTGNNYGDAERRIGIVLQERGGIPDGFVIQTKVDRNMETDDFSGDRVRRSVEESLERLGLDRLGLVHLHDPENISFEEGVAPDGPLEALKALKEEGVIAHLGVAGGPIDLLQQYIRTGAFDVVLTHNRFSLIDQSAEPLFDEAQELGVAALNAAPFGGGVLAGAPQAQGYYGYRKASPRSSRGSRRCTPPAPATTSRSRPPRSSSRPATRGSSRRSSASRSPSASTAWSSSPARRSRRSCGTNSNTPTREATT